MATEIRVPRLGWSMEQGIFCGWRKAEGDRVDRGDVLFELEGEKATQEIEAFDEGVLRIAPNGPQPGATVAVGDLLGYLAEAHESISWAVPVQQGPSALDRGGIPKQAAQVTTTDSNSRRTSTVSGPKASPRARRVAAELGVDWVGLHGSGNGGRIRERDVRLAVEDPSHADAVPSSGVVITPMRREIAARMTLSHQRTAPVTLNTRSNAANLVAARKAIKDSGAMPVPTYTDIMVKLAAAALLDHLPLAGRWEGYRIVLPLSGGIDIAIAVDTPQGLLAPVLRDVCNTPLAELARRSSDLVEQARQGRLAAKEMQGAVFTITNLGGLGIDAFTPIINFPQTAILGLGAIRREAVILESGQIVAGELMTLSLTFDHRVVDGAPSARFLQSLCRAMASMDESSFT